MYGYWQIYGDGVGVTLRWTDIPSKGYLVFLKVSYNEDWVEHWPVESIHLGLIQHVFTVWFA